MTYRVSACSVDNARTFNYVSRYIIEENTNVHNMYLQVLNSNPSPPRLQCFAAGAEIGPHKNTHPYQFIGEI